MNVLPLTTAVYGLNSTIALTQTFNRVLFFSCSGRDFGVQKAKNEDRGTIVFTATLSNGRVSVGIAYTERRENHGTMVLHGASYSAYTLRYGAYCRYEIAPSSQSFLGLLRSFMRRVPWVVLTSHCVSPNVTL